MCSPDIHDVYEQTIDWAVTKDLYGFDGAETVGSLGKYLGRQGADGPWFYLIKHLPHARIVRHSHDADVMHYLVKGSWKVGHEEELVLPGFFHFEPKGVFWGPLQSGPEGSEFIAIYTDKPSFIPAEGNEPGYVDTGVDRDQ